MTAWGTETETTYLDNLGSTVDIISKLQHGDVQQRWKRITLRIKVTDKRDETTQYLIFSDLIEQKRLDGVLILKDSDPSTRPSFVVEFPKSSGDGAYFVVRSFTELVV